jgi:response regulator RpfG family c-di-GMP phosphodiesterase
MTNDTLDFTHKATVLVVDDTPLILALVSGLLKDEYQVRVARNGEQALRVARSDPQPDIILLDVSMPGMDGYEVCRILKESPETWGIPVIFFTANSESEDEAKGLAIGAVDYITKSTGKPILLARLKTHLQLKQHSQFLETLVKKRTEDLELAQGKLEYLVQTGLDMGRERDRLALLRKILFSARDLLHCDAGTLYLATAHDTLSFAMRTREDLLPVFEIPLHDAATGAPVDRFVATHCVLHNEAVIIDDVYAETRFDVSGSKKFDAETGFRTVSMLTVPLAPRDGKVIGALQFINAIDPKSGAVTCFNSDLVRFASALAAQAAVALDNVQLVDAQRDLLDSLIKLIAGAIDAKSPYTGGHCERVPELARMLAEEACKVQTGSLADFSFDTDDEWREFRVGAWLHDCGKVTTPEFVADKATKLETLYNRIHEIRTRFEVLLRDAEIDRMNAIHVRNEDASAANQTCAARKKQLIDDFAFVAECNLGGEFMPSEKIERLERIAVQTWQRHFDDRLGLGHEELKRSADYLSPLPATEHLLADKPQHIVARSDSRAFDEKYGFKLKVPEHLYNLGELNNLSIGRGTLNAEERFKINEHIIQTVVMLEQLPFPDNLKRVPEYACTHHETLAGTGYPRKLEAAQLSVPARIMAIADIFEALTASDRPYKKSKTLSESVKILATFKENRHIDPDLFDLLLSSGVYKRYAQRFLRPAQIDEVDIGKYVGQ